MNHSSLSLEEDQLQNMKNAISLWYRSFIPLVIASVLFVFCFIFESSLLLYLIMAFFFITFIVMYMKANKQILHKDGYTFIQAMSFYQQAQKEGITDPLASPASPLFQLAQKQEYAEDLNPEQILTLYETGKILTNYMKKN